MSNDRIRVRITKQFDDKAAGFRYRLGAIVGVSKGTADKWIADGKAELYDKPAEQPAAPAPAAS